VITVGETATRTRTISEDEIRSFASMCEDFNPLHHDAEVAAASRFGGLIASGPHYVSLLLGLLASHFSKHGAQVGVECSVAFRKPVRPGDTIELQWVVRAIEPKSSGDIVTLDGLITNQRGETVLTAAGKILALKE
jgi:acyl dehydratase